jgi:hypothetical protein
MSHEYVRNRPVCHLFFLIDNSRGLIPENGVIGDLPALPLRLGNLSIIRLFRRLFGAWFSKLDFHDGMVTSLS